MSFYMAGEGRRLFGQTTPSELRDKFNMSVRHADRRGRRDHAVELPDRDPVVEDRARARLRQHRRLQAGDRHARARRALRRAARRGRRPGGRRQRRPRRRRDGRRPARPPPGRAGDHAHRLARDGRRGARRRRPTTSSTSTSSSAARTRSSSSTTPTSTSPSRGSSGRRSAPPGQRCTAASRVIVHERVYDELQSKLVAAAERMRLGPGLGGRHRRRPGDQPGARSRRSTRTRRSARTRARRCSPAARSRPATGSTTASSTGRRSSATSSRGCASRRRRSSARRPR